MGDTMRLGDIIVDPTYQVRKRTSGHKVREYAAAMRNGDEFPPITIELDTLKVVDGFTRFDAYKREYEPDHKITVKVESFANEGERIAYAAKRNMQNGYVLDQWEQGDVIIKLQKHGYKSGDIAPVVNWTLDRVDAYLGAIVVTGKRQKTVKRDTPDQENVTNTVGFNGQKGLEQVALKGGLGHLRGKEITRNVAENIRDHYTGNSARFIARQLLYRINDSTVNVDDPFTMKELQELYAALGEFLSKHNQEVVA